MSSVEDIILQELKNINCRLDSLEGYTRGRFDAFNHLIHDLSLTLERRVTVLETRGETEEKTSSRWTDNIFNSIGSLLGIIALIITILLNLPT
jgi:hypothetical protein